MAFDTVRSRIRSIEKVAQANGVVVAVFLPSDTAEQRAVKDRMLAEARAKGREVIEVRISFGPRVEDGRA